MQKEMLLGQFAVPMTPIELKKLLISAGFEVYRTLGNRVHLAERVRNNLLMDSNVSISCDQGLSVRLVVRAQSSDFPGESDDELLARARAQAAEARARGYVEVDSAMAPIYDPGDRSRRLDTWYEVSFELAVADQDQMVGEVRFALTLDKVASSGHRA